MTQIDIERQSARIWLKASDGGRSSLILGDAECLADLVERMDRMSGDTSARIGKVGISRTGTGIHLSLHQEDAIRHYPIEPFDLGTLARMLRQATTSRIFSGSIGVRDEKVSETLVFDTDFSARTPPPAFTTGGSLDAFDPDEYPPRRRQVEACLPTARGMATNPGVETFVWDDFVTKELEIVDALPSSIYGALKPFWKSFEDGRWVAYEWVRNYAGHDVWRSTSRGLSATNRTEVSADTMARMEQYGLVSLGDDGLRIPAQASYDLWRAVQLAGGLDHRDERMSTPVPLPIGYAAPGMERMKDFDTCIVEFTEGQGRIHHYRIGEHEVGLNLEKTLRDMGIDDPRRAEVATRLGKWLYPERDTSWGGNLANLLSGGRSMARSHIRIGWDAHFLELTRLPHWQERALQRLRRALQAPVIPVLMPSSLRPDDWKADPVLIEGAKRRAKQNAGRKRTRLARAASDQAPID